MRMEAGFCRGGLTLAKERARLDHALFARLRAIDADGLEPDARRFLAGLINDARRAGVDRPQAVREELAALRQEMVQLGQVFHTALSSPPPPLVLSETQLAGLPASWIDAQPRDDAGAVIVAMSGDRYRTVLRHADDRDVRRAAHVAFTNRGHPTNGPIVQRLLRLRHRYATLLGDPSWAAYRAAAEMAGSGEAIEAFIDRLQSILTPKIDAEKRVLAGVAPDLAAEEFAEYDLHWCAQRLQEQIAPDAAVPMGNFSDVLERIFGLLDELFGVTFDHLPLAETWHESVAVYRVSVDGRPGGCLYLDMVPRAGKPPPGVTFPLTTGTIDGDEASVALVGSFDRNEPLWLDDAAVLLHEMGHVLHHLLACRSRWLTQCGTRVEFDFVEAPAMLLERWAERPEILAKLRGEDGSVIAPDALERLCQARRVGEAMLAQRQVFIAAFSYHLHAEDPSELNLERFTDEQFRRHAPWARTAGDRWFANLWHLVDYGPVYYSYLWSDAIARELDAAIGDANGLQISAVRALRTVVFEGGATQAAADLVHVFLGRDWSLDGFRARFDGHAAAG